MAGTLKARIYMVGSTSAIEVDIKDKEKFLDEIKNLTSANEFYIHKDDEVEIAVNTSLIQIIEFSDEGDNKNDSVDEHVGAEEFLAEFGGNPIGSPFQDGHYIYAVIPGGGSGSGSYSPILYVADLENPNNFKKKLQP